MSARVFIGNLSYRTTEAELRRFFDDLGDVASVAIPTDRETGRSRGFAFVEFVSEEHARLAIRVYDGRMLGGRPLRVTAERDGGERPKGRRRPIPMPPIDDEPDLPEFDYGFAGRHRDRAWRRERAAKRSL